MQKRRGVLLALALPIILTAIAARSSDDDVRRTLLVAGGGGSFTAPSPSLLANLGIAPNGGNNPWMTPGAVRHGTKVIGGYVDGNNGNIEAFVYDEVAETIGNYVIHAAFEVDAHTSPALLLTSTGDLLALYTAHASTPINIKVLDPDSPTSWTSATAHSLDADLGGTSYTDLSIFEASDGSLVMLGRDEPVPGTDSRWFYSLSDVSDPTNWSTRVNLYRVAGTRSYWAAWMGTDDVIQIAVTNGADVGYTKLGHFRLNALTLARTASDGSAIAASLPLGFSDTTLVWSGSTAVFPGIVAVDSRDRPVIVGFDDLDYIYRRWTGSAWAGGVITDAGTGFEYNALSGSFQPWGITVDAGDSNTVWLLKDAGGNPDLYRYRTSDNGTSWSSLNVGSAGGEVHTIIPVRNPNKLRAYFPTGSWTDYEDWNTGLVGVLRP